MSSAFDDLTDSRAKMEKIESKLDDGLQATCFRRADPKVNPVRSPAPPSA
jgi:hypothetical protein